MEALSTEMTLAVLLQLDSVKDLLSLIQASPRTLPVYHAYRDWIYLSIAKKEIDPSLLAMARISNRVRHEDQESTSRTTSPCYDGWFSIQKQYKDLPAVLSLPLAPFDCRVPVSTDLPDMSIREARQLHRFHSTTQARVEDAIERAALKASWSRPSSLPSTIGLDTRHPSSDLDACRVTRAFYRWEYITPICKAWAAESTRRHIIRGPDLLPYTSSLRRLMATLASSDDLSDLCFVHGYLHDRFGRFLRQVVAEYQRRRATSGDDDDDGDSDDDRPFFPLGSPVAQFDWRRHEALEFFQHDYQYTLEGFMSMVTWGRAGDDVPPGILDMWASWERIVLVKYLHRLLE